jgi:ureidoacrylate peracid hydrolase
MIQHKLVPEKSCLVLFDVVNAFADPTSRYSVPTGVATLQRLNKLTDVCRSRNIPVIYTVQALRLDGSNWGGFAHIFPAIPKEKLVVDGMWSAEIHPDIAPKEGDIIIKKLRYSSFYGTDLDVILRNKNIDTVIIGGLAVNGPDTTARDACNRDYKVIFLSDGCDTGDYRDEGWGLVSRAEILKVFLTNMARSIGQVMSIDDVILALRQAANPRVKSPG